MMIPEVGSRIIIRHQPELGVREVIGIKILSKPIHLPQHNKIVYCYVTLEGVGNYWAENLEEVL